MTGAEALARVRTGGMEVATGEICGQSEGRGPRVEPR